MKTYLYLYICLFVFLLQWMAGVSVGISIVKTCCMKTTDTKYHPSTIIRYVLYTAPHCPISAVRFYRRFNQICSDPKSIWAIRVMKILDDRYNTTGTPVTALPSSTGLPSSTSLPVSTDFALSTDLPSFTSLPWSTVKQNSPGLTTMTSTTLPVKIAISTKVTNGPSTTDKATTYTKYPSVIMNKAPTATSKSTRTLRTSTRASTQSTSMTSSMAAQSSRKKYVTHTSFKTMEPSRRTKELQSWTFSTRATKRGSTMDKGMKTSVVSLTPEMKTSVVKTSTGMRTSVVSLTPEMKTSEVKTSTGMRTSVVSLMPETKKETQRVPADSRTSTSSPRTTGQELLSRSGPIPRKTDSTTAMLPLALTATTPHKPMELSTVAMVKPAQISKVTRLPWIHRRLKKKSKTGLRRAQKKPRG